MDDASNWLAFDSILLGSSLDNQGTEIRVSVTMEQFAAAGRIKYDNRWDLFDGILPLES